MNGLSVRRRLPRGGFDADRTRLAAIAQVSIISIAIYAMLRSYSGGSSPLVEMINMENNPTNARNGSRNPNSGRNDGKRHYFQNLDSPAQLDGRADCETRRETSSSPEYGRGASDAGAGAGGVLRRRDDGGHLPERRTDGRARRAGGEMGHRSWPGGFASQRVAAQWLRLGADALLACMPGLARWRPVQIRLGLGCTFWPMCLRGRAGRWDPETVRGGEIRKP
jgi:hypothetical protein